MSEELLWSAAVNPATLDEFSVHISIDGGGRVLAIASAGQPKPVLVEPGKPVKIAISVPPTPWGGPPLRLTITGTV